ncbi:MAG: MotA/TolQ/ExbB proton channel family protein [Comamonadaceae bacterium]|nr:MAG: MotA/TolQ/ExbB proton channel family protein [Comamonadaceae bacterium]
MSALELLTQGDVVGRAVALLLLLMSIASWVVILQKAWLLRGGAGGVLRAVAAFWQASALPAGVQACASFDRADFVRPLAATVPPLAQASDALHIGAQGPLAPRLTRALRDALHGVLRRLQAGQILLATIGATAPFVGLLGTVWGIHRALASIAGQSGGFTLDKVAGPVGEALVMTAFGLAVAIPAVLAYNVFGRIIGRIEAELEGFAHDLLATFAPADAAPAPTARPMPVAQA